MGRSGSKLWKYAAAVGVMGLLMMMAAILVANRWENMFGIAVLLGLVCTWIAAADACGCMGTGAVV